jgi:superfamily I DNA/RNA helicase
MYFSGDEDESIYESKGGLPRLMADVSIRLPNARCYVLDKNWRSHPAIVDHSRQLIANLARRRIAKDMISGWGPSQTGAIVGPQVCDTEETEAQWVAEEISQLMSGGRDAKDIAVLYRYHRYGIIIEEALSRRGIRCVTSHPEAGLIPDEVGDVMAFLRLVMDPDGPKARESFERVCQLRVKEIDPKLFATISGFAEVNNLSYLKAVEIYSEAVPDPGCQDLRKLVSILRDLNQRNLPPVETISKLRRTQGLNDYYKLIKVPPGVQYEPLQKLAQLEEDAKSFATVSEFVKAQTSVPKQSSSSRLYPAAKSPSIMWCTFSPCTRRKEKSSPSSFWLVWQRVCFLPTALEIAKRKGGFATSV